MEVGRYLSCCTLIQKDSQQRGQQKVFEAERFNSERLKLKINYSWEMDDGHEQRHTDRDTKMDKETTEVEL